jgi:rSAM/selenodomain-associated transferase 2
LGISAVKNGFQISVIIPALNESLNLAATFTAIRANSIPAEVILVDAGSHDSTADIAGGFGAQVIQCAQKQRAAQLNVGAAAASADVFLFLHADTLLPKNAFEKIIASMENRFVVGGAFARKFKSDSSFLRISCVAAEIRNRLIGWHLGDQAIFCRKSVFLKLKGFKHVDRFEDLDFSRRMASEGRLVTLRPPVLTSGRRFDREGPVLRTWRDFLITLQYLRGNQAVLQIKDNPKDARLEQ